MVIGFQKEFVSKIKDGTKIHTIREDKNDRWKAGRKMHLSTGVRTSEMKIFAEKVCVSVQSIEFRWKIITDTNQMPDKFSLQIFIDKKDVTNKINLASLAKADGFDTFFDFIQWEAWDKKHFKGKIIHWTDKRY